MIASKTQTVEKIDNQLVEKMFFLSASYEEQLTYQELLRVPIRGHGLATSYASKRVAKTFLSMLSEQTGLDYSGVISYKK